MKNNILFLITMISVGLFSLNAQIASPDIYFDDEPGTHGHIEPLGELKGVDRDRRDENHGFGGSLVELWNRFRAIGFCR